MKTKRTAVAVSQISSEVARGSTATQGGVCWIYFSQGKAYAGIISGIKFNDNRLVLELSKLAEGLETDQMHCEINWRRIDRGKDASPVVFKFDCEEESRNGHRNGYEIEPRVSMLSPQGHVIILSSMSDDVREVHKLLK